MRAYTRIRLSPDGKKAIVCRTDASDRKNDLWLLDFGRAVTTRLTVDGRETGFAVWSPDGRSIAYSSERSGVVQTYRKDAASGGQEEQLTDGPEPSYVTGWSRDGRYLCFTRFRGSGYGIWALPAKTPPGVRPEEYVSAFFSTASYGPEGPRFPEYFHSYIQQHFDNQMMEYTERRWTDRLSVAGLVPLSRFVLGPVTLVVGSIPGVRRVLLGPFPQASRKHLQSALGQYVASDPGAITDARLDAQIYLLRESAALVLQSGSSAENGDELVEACAALVH